MGAEVNKYAAARDAVVRDFDRHYYRDLYDSSDRDIRRASKMSGIEIDHLRDRSNSFRITYPRKPARSITPWARADIRKRILEKQTNAEIALRHGIGRGRVSQLRREMKGRRRA